METIYSPASIPSNVESITMKKRSMHRLHIENDIWKWYVSKSYWTCNRNVIVFAPTGKRYEIDLEHFGSITPAAVKEYIIKNLQKQDAAWELCRA